MARSGVRHTLLPLSNNQRPAPMTNDATQPKAVRVDFGSELFNADYREQITSLLERRLCLAGAVLFLFGLVLGFAVPAFPARQAILNAHLTALGSGTFLIVIGLLWRKLGFSPKWSNVFGHLLWISFYVLQAGLTIAATSARTVGAPQSTTQMIAGVLNAIGGILMMVPVTAIVVALAKSKPATDA